MGYVNGNKTIICYYFLAKNHFKIRNIELISKEQLIHFIKTSNDSRCKIRFSITDINLNDPFVDLCP